MEKKPSTYKNPKIRNFLFFLGMAILLWFLTKFSNEIKANIEAEIQYVNVPEEVLLSENNPKQFSMDLSANGYKMLLYAVKDAVLEIDISAYYTSGINEITISQAELSGLVKRQLGVGNVENVSLSPLKIQLDKSIQKKVAVFFNGSLNYKDGYKSVGGIQLEPDTVLLRGPSEIISEIDTILTKSFSRKNIEESFSQNLDLLPPASKKVKMEPNVVTVSLEVAEFTQKQVNVPIQLKNVPEDINLRLIPENVMVKFEVAVDDFNTIDSTHFQVICDFDDKISEGNFMIPKIVSKPDNVYRVDLDTKKVEYLIFK